MKGMGKGEKIRVGVSSCLLGERVRHDGQHKLDRYLRDTLGAYFDYIPVCPEVECGLPTPRESMRLSGDVHSPRLITTRTGVDHTRRMSRWANKRVKELTKEDICGFIFKTKSPSSGMRHISVFGADGVAKKQGVGIFARFFMERFPLIPVEDDERLHDPGIRENFIERIFTFKRFRECMRNGKKRGNLMELHTRHKLLILSHSPEHYRRMGKLVAQGKRYPPLKLFDTYQIFLLEALSRKSTPAKNAKVLHHILGYFKKTLSADEKQEMLEIIGDYRRGLVPLIVPITLSNLYVRRYGQEYLAGQYYLNPHPIELKFRTHS